MAMKNSASDQHWLFPPSNDGLTISDAALFINVSEATIRNWIKTGGLSLQGGLVDKASIEAFRSDVAGVSKLTSRANKLYADFHDHEALIQEIYKNLNKDNVAIGKLSSIYENGLSDSYKNKEGVYYTPDDICNDMFSFIDGDVSNLIFFDPCCGTGNFLIAALRAGFRPQNVYGCDIDEVAITIARSRIKDMSGHDTNNLFASDFLSRDFRSNSRIPLADVVFTNPPWGKKLNLSLKEELSKELSCQKSLDTSGIFLILSRFFLKNNSTYGMVLPESFFNVAAFEQPRKVILQDNVICITDHGKAFAGLLTKAVSFVAKKNKGKDNDKILCRFGGNGNLRSKSSFLNNPKSIINYYSDDQASDVLEHIFQVPHITLYDRARWALGVVTGNNKKHLSEIKSSGFVPIYKGSDITKDGLKNAASYISTDMSKFQQVAPMEMYQAPEKIIYKFISSKIVCHYDCNQSMILNSANLLITDDDFPIGMELLADYLNSDFANWVFDNIFHTHKVLRSDLEKLPIYHDILSSMDCFDEEILLDRLGLERVFHGSYRIKK